MVHLHFIYQTHTVSVTYTILLAPYNKTNFTKLYMTSSLQKCSTEWRERNRLISSLETNTDVNFFSWFLLSFLLL